MIQKSLACAVLLALPLAAAAESSIARFEGGIGSQPLRAGGAPNLVFNTPPGGAPWVISQLSADVKSDGRISVAGRGLLLGGGNGIGTTAGQSVRARLVCGGVAQDTALPATPLEPDGDFRIEETFVPAPPSPCVGAVLLIINANGSWFAAGIPKL